MRELAQTVCFVGQTGEPMTPDDALVAPALAEAGLRLEHVPWDAEGVDWPAFDVVVVRSTWDYFVRIEEFRAWIDAREDDRTNLWNPPRVLRWNSDKRYLAEFERAGLPVVPTAWLPAGRPGDLAAVLRDRGWDRAVAKPVVSGGGYRTFTAERGTRPDDELVRLMEETDTAVQPFLEEVVRDGEWSMVFFGGEHSHALVKRAAPGQFLVQHRHGGTIHEAEPTPEMLDAARRVLSRVDDELLYARVDGVLIDGVFTLMELEVLEPALFFAQGPGSPRRFVEALRERLRRPGGARPSSSPAPR